MTDVTTPSGDFGTCDFSVVIPSRNRPELVREALASVLAQSHPSLEIIVVNDGSDETHLPSYTLLAEAPGVRLVQIQRTLQGHGPSYALNRGVEVACGRFVCFLDDDDTWTDPHHLARAAAYLAANEHTDVYLACQAAYRGETQVNEPLWLNALAGLAPGANEPRRVTMTSLLSCPTFAHLNTMICRRTLYAECGGMDESIRYECEWDLYFRLIEGARQIAFHSGYVARHNVPDAGARANASTVVSDLQKLLLRIRVMDKALLFSGSPAIRRRAGEVKTLSLKRIAELMAKRGEWRTSLHYASEAMWTGFNIKWTAYCCYLAVRALTAQNAPGGAQGAKT